MRLIAEHPFGAGGLKVRHHQLDNGLEILLLADRAAPVIAYQTWFRVGSRHERDGITGIAHLFEHLMFNQTTSHAPGEFDRIMEAAGAETNAATWVDWTYYRNNLPTSALAMAVGLESDRMANLVLGDEQVESEREVVANERRFRVEDDVDGFLDEELYKRIFTKHPYHWPTIGWMRDIEAITIDDCRAFYRTYYAPNNATLVIAGDVDEATVLPLLDKAYGGLARQPIPVEKFEFDAEPTAEQRVEFGKHVAADKLKVGWRAPAFGEREFAALEVLTEVLFGGNSSRLYRALVSDTEICTAASGGATPFRDPGVFEIAASLQRGRTAEEALAVLDRELGRVTAEPISEEELRTSKTRLETRFWRDLRSVAGKCEALGHFHTTLGDYRRLFGVSEQLLSITATEMQAVAKRYLQPHRRTIVIGRPAGDAS